MRTINEIIIHCSATPEGKDFTVEDITRWHKARGFLTIGYHYVIYRDGSIHKGRPIEQKGAHCLNHNAHSIGICYIGGYAADGKTVKDTRTPEQKQALLKLLKELKAKFPNATIHGHREFVCNNRNHGKCPGCAMMPDSAICKYASKACPSFNATREYKSLAVAMICIVASLVLTGCRSYKQVVEEKADNSVQQAVAMSATSSTTDKFLQNIVLNIDSIVFTSLSMPQMSKAADEQAFISNACDNSDSQKESNASPTKKRIPRNATKVVIGGIRLQATTADSSHVQTSMSSENTHQASNSSLVKTKVVKKPTNKWCLWLLLIGIAVIAMAVAIAITKENNPLLALISYIRKKVKT